MTSKKGFRVVEEARESARRFVADESGMEMIEQAIVAALIVAVAANAMIAIGARTASNLWAMVAFFF